MPFSKITIEMNDEIIKKLRQYFPGRIGELLERKAKVLIQEMEDTPKIVDTGFQIKEDGLYINYSPGKFMDKKAYYNLLEVIPPGVVVTSQVVDDFLCNRVKAWQSIPSKKGSLVSGPSGP